MREGEHMINKIARHKEVLHLHEVRVFKFSVNVITYTSERLPGGLYFSIPSRAHILFMVCSGISSRISKAC